MIHAPSYFHLTHGSKEETSQDLMEKRNEQYIYIYIYIYKTKNND